MAAVSGRWNSPSFVLLLFILSGLTVVHGWDSIDLELFDLVEEIKDNFYEVLGLTQDAEQAAIRRAYRKLSLQLHPDRNKEPDAEIKFRQLVAVSEVLKDEDKRKRYDAILRDGLPDWRQPVYYYRRVRKMGLIEFLLLIFLILTIGHYIVAWSIYLEKKFELEELLFSKMKREEKKRKKEKLKSKLNDDDIPDLADMLVEEAGVSKPTFQDLLPLKLARMLVNFCRTLPQQSQELLEYWRERKREKIEEDEDEEEEEEEEKDQPTRPRRRQRVNVIQEETDDADWEGAPVTSVLTKEEDVEQPAAREKSGEWTDHELSLLSRAMIKFPGGTPKRWDKIAVEIGRSVEEVTKQMKRMKQSYGVPVNPSNSDAGELRSLVMNKKKAVVSDECMESYDNVTTVDPQTANKPKNSKPAVKQVAVKSTDSGAVPAPGKGKDATNSKPAIKQVARPSTDTGAMSTLSKEKQDTMDSLDSSKDGVVDTDGSAWSQNQQKQLEQALQQFPKTVADRWICIARAVPGKTKEECISRYKFLVECVRKRKLAGQQ